MSRRKTFLFSALALTSLLASLSWSYSGAPGEDSATSATSRPATALARTLEAHGGVERWRQQRSFRYTLNGFPLSKEAKRPNTSIVDLQNRKNRIEGQGFTVGFDGKQAWALPDKDAAGLPARFFTLGSFYFIGMPFVFADPGVEAEELPPARYLGKEYRVVRITYVRGVGYTPDDDYVLYIDPDTWLLKLIHHSVTEPSKRVKRVSWVFDSWQAVAGLQVPRQMTFYGGWNHGKDPGKGATFTIDNVALGRETPDAGLYARPAAAAVDDSPYGN